MPWTNVIRLRINKSGAYEDKESLGMEHHGALNEM